MRGLMALINIPGSAGPEILISFMAVNVNEAPPWGDCTVSRYRITGFFREGKMRPYKPSNGFEGDVFFGSWCSKCARDGIMNGSMDWDEAEREGKLCPIIANTMALEVTDEKYPKEWVVKNGRPTCTAYTEHVWPGCLSEAEKEAQVSLF